MSSFCYTSMWNYAFTNHSRSSEFLAYDGPVMVDNRLASVFFADHPFEHLMEITEAVGANPMAVVLGGVPFTQRTGHRFGKFRKAKCTMIVIPCYRWSRPCAEKQAFLEHGSHLTRESPVIFFDHFRSPYNARCFSPSYDGSSYEVTALFEMIEI